MESPIVLWIRVCTFGTIRSYAAARWTLYSQSTIYYIIIVVILLFKLFVNNFWLSFMSLISVIYVMNLLCMLSNDDRFISAKISRAIIVRKPSKLIWVNLWLVLVFWSLNQRISNNQQTNSLEDMLRGLLLLSVPDEIPNLDIPIYVHLPRFKPVTIFIHFTVITTWLRNPLIFI